jgi:hypothetical protein
VELVQSRIVTADVAGLAAFYARLVGTPVALNDYYVEVHTGAMSVGFSRHASPSTRRTRRRGPAARTARMRSSSTSWSATLTGSSSG